MQKDQRRVIGYSNNQCRPDNYSTQSSTERRLVAGVDLGGYIKLRHDDLFYRPEILLPKNEQAFEK